MSAHPPSAEGRARSQDEMADGQEDEQMLGKRKRQKVTRACDACRSKKKRCTGKIPCDPCSRLRIPCSYEATYSRGAPPSPARTFSGISQVVVPPQRPSEPLASEPRSRRLSSDPSSVAGQYHGPTSALSFLGRAWKRLNNGQLQSSPPRQPEHNLSRNASVFSFGDKNVPAVDSTDFTWPHPVVARELLQRYFDFSAPTYRILHRATVSRWVSQLYENQSVGHGDHESISVAAQAVVLEVFATASMFRLDTEGNIRDADLKGWHESELFHDLAQQKLSREVGPPTLQSVQARFLTVLYLLCSSRANKAWFTHGTMVQLMMALGLHRKRGITSDGKPVDHIHTECQKRTFWCSYVVDKYLSLVLGRPRLLQDEDIDQEFPAHVNDEDITVDEIAPKPGRDCAMDAPIYHARLSQILSRASKEQYAILSISDQQHIDASLARTENILAWQALLPPFISGAIQASSLVPVFRRQQTVLRLAYFHAIMFVTRPLLVRNHAKDLTEHYQTKYRKQVRICVNAAKDAVDLILVFARENQLFPAFWFSQYIAFNAISIIYVYTTQLSRDRLPDITFDSEDGVSLDLQALLKLGEIGQHHLAKATSRNAPTWNYSLLLEGLRIEANRLMTARQVSRTLSNTGSGSGSEVAAQRNISSHRQLTIPLQGGPGISGIAAMSFETNATDSPSHAAMYSVQEQNVNTSFESAMIDPTDMRLSNTRAENMFEEFTSCIGDEELDLDFWPQLDSLPLSCFGLNNILGNL